MSDLSRVTRDLLRRGRPGASMDPRHRERLKATILIKVAGGSVVTTAATASAWTSVGAKVVGAVAIVAAAGVGVAAKTGALSRVESPRAVPSQLASGRAEVVATASPLRVGPSAEPPPSPEPPALARAAPPAESLKPPETTSLPSGPVSGVAPRETPAREPETLDPPWVASESVRDGGGASPWTVPEPPSAEVAPASVVSSTPAPPPVVTADIQAQVTLLQEAERAARDGDAERALALLDRHVARFPTSALEPERSAERVFALCRAKRGAEASADAKAFLQTHPSGALAARVRASCGGTNLR